MANKQKFSEIIYIANVFVFTLGLVLSIFTTMLWFVIRLLQGMSADSSISYPFDFAFLSCILSFATVCVCIIQFWWHHFRFVAFLFVCVGTTQVVFSKLFLSSEFGTEDWLGISLAILGVIMFITTHLKNK